MKYIILILLFSTHLSAQKLGEQSIVKKQKKSLFLEQLSLLEKILSTSISEKQHFSIPYREPVELPEWKYVTGPLEYLDVGSDGTLFGITKGKKIIRLKDDKFVYFKGRGKKVSVGDKKNICLIDNKRNIFKLIKNKWVSLRGQAKNISCSSDGLVMAVHTNKNARNFNLKNNSLVIRSKTKWKNFMGHLKQVSVGSKNNIWGIDNFGSPWHYDGLSWSKEEGTFKHVSAAKDGSVAAVTDKGGLVIRSGKTWVKAPGKDLEIVSIQQKGSFWALTTDGSVWKSLSLNTSN